MAEVFSLSLARFVAAGFGTGWLPKAPGTWGSLAALLPGWLLFYYTGLLGLGLAIVAISLLGFVVCARVLPTLKDQDPGWIVIDEWAGQWLCMLIVAWVMPGDSLLLPVAAFLLFRFFDILKPWPIRPLEHLGPPWWSIMVDDLAAGLLGGATMAAISGVGLLLTGGGT